MDEAELNKTLEKLKKEKVPESKIEISRFKGLGEMNEKSSRKRLWILKPDACCPLSLGGISREFSQHLAMNILMAAKEAESRRRWIERHGDQFEPDI